MNNMQKCLKGELYDANDPILVKDRINCKNKCQILNNITYDNNKSQIDLLLKIIKKCGSNPYITTPFYCDYGYNIEIGDNFYSNHNLTILDCNKVIIGNNVFIGPNCCISTAYHPIDHKLRNTLLEYSKQIIIKDNVWIGANVTILAGVTIGDNCVIGAGSVVTKNLSSNTVCYGVPCKEIKSI